MGADPKVYFSRKGATQQRSKGANFKPAKREDGIIAIAQSSYITFAALRYSEKNILFNPLLVRNDHQATVTSCCNLVAIFFRVLFDCHSGSSLATSGLLIRLPFSDNTSL